MSTLLEISADLGALRDLIDATDAELTPETEEALDLWFAELGEARDAKLDGYCALCRELTLRAAARREEQERLALRVRVDEALAKRLKDRLKLFLELQGVNKVETARYRISVCGNGGKAPLEVTVAPELLPPQYLRVRYEADTERLHADLAAGLAVPGARLLERGTHLRIG